jgi:lipoprotein-anchoring transpeptidase ErfK/SrfK
VDVWIERCFLFRLGRKLKRKAVKAVYEVMRRLRVILTVFSVSVLALVPLPGSAQTANVLNWRSTAEIRLPNQIGSQLRVEVRLRARRVYVYEGETVIANYPIAVGKRGWETPIGDYQIFSKEVNPTFKNFKTGVVIPPGVENPLGVRWIGFWTDGKTQIGFHGTNQPELIGEAVSHGCIRMRNKDVVSLFNRVPIGTSVIVKP